MNNSKNKTLEKLLQKWIDSNIKAYSCALKRQNDKREEEKTNIQSIFLQILGLNKDDILNKLEGNEKQHFISLFKDKNQHFLRLNDGEINAVTTNLDKTLVYNFLIGYGLYIRNRSKESNKAIKIWENTIDLAKMNNDIIYQGRSKKVLKIKPLYGEKTIIFKKAEMGGRDELKLENYIWIYYRLLKDKLIFKKDLDGKEQEFIFNLPEKILFSEGVLKDKSTYIIWRADSEDLLKISLNSDNKIRKNLIKSYIRGMKKVCERKNSFASIKKILSNYEIIAERLSNSKIKGIVKDSILKNGAYSNEGITCIDFDRLRIAPLQMELSKSLILSYDNRHELLKDFIETYNSAAQFFNKNFANKDMYFPFYKTTKKEPKRQEIKDIEEFYFTYLNSVIDYALHFILENEYYEDFEKINVKSIQKNNAQRALKELKSIYKDKYDQVGLKKLSLLQDIFENDF